VADHGPEFEAWMRAYPRLLEARAYLAGVDHATAAGLDRDVDTADDDADGDAEGEAEPVVDVTTPSAALARPASRSRRTPEPPGSATLW
jgi:hypothetical protein